MGAGASVLQSSDDDVIDLDTFALVQQEYRRLSCREVHDNRTDENAEAAAADADAETRPSDEEVFVRLKSVVVQRYEVKRPGTESETTHDEHDGNADVKPHGDAVSDPDADNADAKATSTEDDGPRLHLDPHDADHADAKDLGDDALDGPDDAVVRVLQRPLTADALLALADSIPDVIAVDDDDDGDHNDGDDTFHGPGASSLGPPATNLSSSLSEGSMGRAPAAHLGSLASSSSSNSASSSAFDLTQNLTPVFTTDVLTDPTTLKMITSYAERERIAHGGDWIKFWVEIDELAQLPSHSYTHRRLRKIYDKFLSPEAQSPVCVTSGMLSEIEAALQGDNISAGIYADAQQICLTALEQSVFPRFRENRLYKKMLEFCAPSPASSKHLQQQSHQQQQAEPEDYSLQGILAHPAKLRFLKTYCMEALALENLLFYLEVEDCKRLPNLSFIVNKTRKIYDRYCTASSRNFLHLPDAVFAELHAAAEANQALLPKLFYEPQLLVFQRISDEIWKTYCRTNEYLEFSRKLKPERRKLPYARNAVKFSPEQHEQLLKKLDSMNEFQLIEAAMHYPVAKLIPLQNHGTEAAAAAIATTDAGHGGPVFTPAEQLSILLGDAFGRKFFKQFMHKRGVDHFLAFVHEVDDFKLLPGIEFLQHTAKKIYRKYILPSAKMQVDMSRAMRDEIGERLLSPSIDMFKRISQRVRHGMLQDSMPRFVKSSYYNDLRKLAKQFKEHAVESDLKAIDAAAKKGKLELTHLDMLLQNQLSTKQFRLFLESQHCAENLMLYEEIEHFRRLPSYQIVLRSAKKIYDKYLNPSNTRNPVIPVSEALRNRVVEQLEAASRTTFDEVENECGEFMRNVVVPDFLDSRIFMALVGTWSIVDDEYPAEMLKGEFEMAFLRHRFHLVQESRGLSRDTSTPKGMLG